MEINYELIIKYLTKNIKKENKSVNFITQKSILNYSQNFPDRFKTMLGDKFYRYGITVYDNDNINISFWSSILTLLDKKFMIPYSTDEIAIINNFKLQLIEKNKKFKIDLLRDKMKMEVDTEIIQYVVDVLDINIIIFDFESLELNSLYSKDMMNPWKKTLLLAKYKKFWEPIILDKNKGETDKLFDFNNLIIKKLLLNETIKYYDGDKTNKTHIMIDDIYEILKMEKNKLKIVIEPVKQIELLNSESSVQTNESSDSLDYSEYKKLNKTRLTKMKLEELHKLIEKLDIVIKKPNVTKTHIVEMLLEKIKSL
jgi:hypothetical protein